MAVAVGLVLTLGACGGGGGGSDEPVVPADPILTAIQAVPSVKELTFVSPDPATCPTTSHPFSTMLCSLGESYDQTGTKPIDIKKTYGYTEREFVLSGKANVYDLDTDQRAKIKTSGNAYATRLLVRYPSDPAKFNGRVYVDILNASSGVDLEDTWRRSWEHMMKNGYAYVGITSKSLTADALKKFDATRYADINWKVNGTNEDGLVWDMLSQLGTLLRKTGTGGILGTLQPKYVYLGGQSQSGFYMNTYLAAFTDRLETAGTGGKPLFDGYMNLVGPTATTIRTGGAAPTKLYKATSVPQIVIVSEAESGWYNMAPTAFPPYVRRVDSNSATDKFRFYEVAGAPHSDPTSPIIPINTEISKAKADGTSRAPKPYGTGHEEDAIQLDYFVTGALENLHAWAAAGTPAPAADANWMWFSTSVDSKGNTMYTPLRDQVGNALGGLRSPLIEAPLYRYYGMAVQAGTVVPAFDWGSMIKLPDATINTLYGGKCNTYVATFNAATDALVTGRYITATDAAKLKAQGKDLATKASAINPAVAWTTPCN